MKEDRNSVLFSYYRESDIILVGYSGHALVVAEALTKAGHNIAGYLDRTEKDSNPLQIPYLGFEKDETLMVKLMGCSIFPAIGDNRIREDVFKWFYKKGYTIPAVVHYEAKTAKDVEIGIGTIVCRGALINPFVKIGVGCIINTGAIIEHECTIGSFAHIAPGTVVAGNVIIEDRVFVGANSVLKQGIVVGQNAIIGAGSVVINNVPADAVIAGNPARKL